MIKKAILTTVLIMLVASSPALSFDGATATQAMTSSGQAVTGACWITGLAVVTNGTNDATITVYDGTSTSGAMIGTYYVPGALYGDRAVWTFPRRVNNGIYVNVSGTGASAVVEYRR